MASLTGQTISSTYDGLLKTSDNDVLTTDGKEITDGLGNGSGVSLDTNGNIIAEGTIKAIGGIRDTSNDLGTSGQVLSSTGTGTNWVAPSIADDSVTYAKLGTEFTTSAALATNVDFSTAQVFTKTLSADTTLTFSNASIGMVKDLVITGSHALTLPTGSTVAGTYNGAVSNLIQVVVTGAAEYWFSISQAQ
jgi:hypothetical protein